MLRYLIRTFKTILLAVCLLAALSVSNALADSSSEIRCKGHGIISFEGSGTLTFIGDGGVLIVNDNAEMTFSYGSKDSSNLIRIPQCLETGEGNCVYIGVDADKTTVSGEDLEVFFMGANIGLNASGNGTLNLKGYGVYLQDKVFGTWDIDGQTIDLVE